MKVRNVNSLNKGAHGLRSIDHPGDITGREVVFKRTLSDLNHEQQSTALALLADEIAAQGAKLAKKADVRELERYRSLIKKFLDQIVSNGYQFDKENSFAARGRHRLFATVQTVNKKLDELAREVLSGQAENIGIMARVDEIRGLLVDMLT